MWFPIGVTLGCILGLIWMRLNWFRGNIADAVVLGIMVLLSTGVVLVSWLTWVFA